MRAMTRGLLIIDIQRDCFRAGLRFADGYATVLAADELLG
jgi:hypothetical protein